MRLLSYLLVIALILGYACSSSKSGSQTSNEEVKTNDLSSIEMTQDTIHIENEELEYEITIIELGFNNWLATQPPMTYYALNVLERRNINYVYEWNQRAANPMTYNPNLYNQFIDYEPTIRYGLEVNYMLFMYFEFFQDKYRQRL